MPALADLQPSQPYAFPVLRAALQGGRLHHAYLFTSRDAAAIAQVQESMARALVCVTAEGCGTCAPCRKLTSGNHPDLARLVPNEKDAISVDMVRELIARLSLRAVEARQKVVVIERAERMNAAAQNALLKTLEEPPGATVFLVGTTRPRSLAITVRSRCQRMRLAARSTEAVTAELTQSLPELDKHLARVVSALAGGDIASAKTTLEAGAEEIHTRTVAAAKGRRLRDALSAAADLGSDRDRADMALAFLEVLVRDGLAKLHGASAEHIIDAPLNLPGAKLAQAAAKLTELRRVQSLHWNRTLALESLLLAFS
ncbi:MAG: DNA polymerase III subunit [Clostridia bacterium]|nr:DNA polymerase III subunit [Deltaproteobacteria bacterium]